jgi:alkylation response protein AidB-like acyl-CoA dehydrogenase
MTVPAAYGGHGRSSLERYVVTEELLAAGAPVAAHWIADRQTAPSLLRFGTERQKQQWLPGIAGGECFFAIGLSEPDAGSDLAAVKTKAVAVPGGYRVTGTKVWTSGAHRAHAFVVLARTTPVDPHNRHAGLSQLIVRLDAPGVTIRPILLLNGEHHFNEVLLDGVFVADDDVLGDIGNGWTQVTAELAFERSGPERVLSTFPLLAALAEELRSRTGEPVADFGELVASIWTLRRLSLAIAGALERGESPEVAAALVKDLGTRCESDITEVARRIVAFEPDPGADTTLGRLYAEAVIHAPGFTLRGGTNEILRGVVARGLGLR